MNKCKIRMPDKEHSKISFKNEKNKIKVPFVIYADTESMLIPTEDEKKYQKHEMHSIGYFTKCSYDDSLSEYKSFRRQEPGK